MTYSNNNSKDKKQYSLEYYERNKDSIKEKMKEKIKCECGGEYTKYNKNNHEKTQKHVLTMKIKNLENINTDDLAKNVKERIIKELSDKIEISINMKK